MGQVVLVTGVAGDLGRRVAAQLSTAPGVDRVVGVDVLPPRGDLGAADFVRADIRNPVIAKVMVRERVDTVVHTSVNATAAAAGGRASTKELNVIGTMQLLAACQQSPEVRKLVLKSSASFYGASHRDPAMFTEQMTAKRLPGGGYAKDVTEVESYTRGFARRRPDVGVTTLRLANVIGPTITSGMSGYFGLAVVPTVLGFNPRMQFLHEQDALDVLQHATTRDVTGTYNVAGDGMLTLSQAVRRLGRPTLPLPGALVPTFGQTLRQTKVADFSPDAVAFLTYGRGLDTTRMRSMLGFEPAHTSAEAFESFVASLRPGPLAPPRVRAVEQGLVGAMRGLGPQPGPEALPAWRDDEADERPAHEPADEPAGRADVPRDVEELR
ncbi:NAD-dependent epimerase/dehydratase family protein [Nocardioides marmoraquaticus]